MKRFALIMMLIAAMAVPAAAQAQTGYGNVAGATPGASGPGSTGSSNTSAPAAVATTSDEVGGGVLPFTGMQLVLIFGTGVLLLGTGLLLRRVHSE